MPRSACAFAALLVSAILGASGCHAEHGVGPGEPDAQVTAPNAKAPGAVGFTAFTAPPVALAAYDEAQRAVASGRTEDARAALAQALDADPEYAAAHRLLAGALAAGGDAGGAVQQLSLALSEDLLRTEQAVRRDPALASLVSNPAIAARVQAYEAQDLAAYAESLGDALLFVARDGPPRVRLRARGAERFVDRREELYAFDPASGRFRGLTQTGGHVAGWIATPDRKAVVLLAWSRLEGDGATARIADPALWRLELATLDLVGPVALPAGQRVAIGFSAAGAPVATSDGARVEVDFGALRATPSPSAAPAQGEELWAWPGGAALHRPTGEAVPASMPGGLLLDPSSAVAGPGDRTAEAEAMAQCQPVAPGAASQPSLAPRAYGDLFVLRRGGGGWLDVGTARRRAELAWLGDALLAYADGDGAAARVHLAWLDGALRETLATPFGAGLHGIVDSPDCADQAAPASSAPATQPASQP